MSKESVSALEKMIDGMKPSQALTPMQIVRLECLRLAHRPDKDALTNTERAEQLAEYVLQGKPRPEGRTGQ